jgi:glutamine synthetase
MAKPMEHQPGSAMHLHQSVVERQNGDNLFADAGGADSEMFRHFVGGLQTYLPQIAPLFAPNVNSFRRMRPSHSAPINLQWGYDNRSCGLRVPISDGQSAHREPPARRRRQSLPGHRRHADLRLCRHRGGDRADARGAGNAYHDARTLPKDAGGGAGAVQAPASRCATCWARPFFRAFAAIKEAELEAFQA